MLKKQETKKISRRELYDLVWSRPIMDIAAEFGISDRGLGKVCERYNIPKPPRGYWQRIAAGEKIKIPKLHAMSNLYQETVHIQVNVKETLPENVNDKINEQLSEPITIPSKISKLHPLVKQTEKSVCLELRHRRNLILNALFLKLETNGFSIKINDDCFEIIFERERTYLKISEHFKKNKRQLTEQEEKKKLYSTQKWVYEYEATHKLKLTLNNYKPDSYFSSIYASFMDTKNTLLEENINDIYSNIVKTLYIEREKTIKEEKERKIREEIERQKRVKEQKIKNLLAETQKFILADNIRAYVKSKENAYNAGKVKMVDFEEWKVFGLSYADELDPSFTPEKLPMEDNHEDDYDDEDDDGWY